jgi:hypothetical protein
VLAVLVNIRFGHPPVIAAEATAKAKATEREMRTLAITAFGVVLLGLSATCIKADPDSCRDAVDQFQSARDDLESAIQSYAGCVSDSTGHDDCSSEASSVQSDQSDFESAVSEYGSECD